MQFDLMFPGIQSDTQQSDVHFQHGRYLPILQGTPTPIERCLKHKDSFLIEAHATFDSRLAK
jgi:hypothetical protein